MLSSTEKGPGKFSTIGRVSQGSERPCRWRGCLRGRGLESLEICPQFRNGKNWMNPSGILAGSESCFEIKWWLFGGQNRKQRTRGQPFLGQPLDIIGAPAGIRTPGLRIRSPLLYPAELRALWGTAKHSNQFHRLNRRFGVRLSTLLSRDVCKTSFPLRS